MLKVFSEGEEKTMCESIAAVASAALALLNSGDGALCCREEPPPELVEKGMSVDMDVAGLQLKVKEPCIPSETFLERVGKAKGSSLLLTGVHCSGAKALIASLFAQKGQKVIVVSFNSPRAAPHDLRALLKERDITHIRVRVGDDTFPEVYPRSSRCRFDTRRLQLGPSPGCFSQIFAQICAELGIYSCTHQPCRGSDAVAMSALALCKPIRAPAVAPTGVHEMVTSPDFSRDKQFQAGDDGDAFVLLDMP